MSIISAAFLMPTARIQQRRQDNQQSLVAQQMLTQQSQQELLFNQQQRSLLEAKYEKLKDMPFLAPSKRELSALLETMEGEVQEKIKTQFNNDTNAYVQSMGQADVMRIGRRLTESDEYKRATASKTAYLEWMEDRKAGKMSRLQDGMQMDQVYSLFNAGAVNQLTYGGGYKPAEKFYDRLTKTQGRNYFGTPEENIANPTEVLSALSSELGNARDAVDQYQQMGMDKVKIYMKTADPLDMAKFKHDIQKDAADLQMKAARLAFDKSAHADRMDLARRAEKQQLDLMAYMGTPSPAVGDVHYNWGNGPVKEFEGKRYPTNEMNIIDDAFRKTSIGFLGKSGTWEKGPKDLEFYKLPVNAKAQLSDGTATAVSGFRPERVVTRHVPGRGQVHYLVGYGLVDEKAAERSGKGNMSNDWGFSTKAKVGGSNVENVADTFGWSMFNPNEKGKYMVDNIYMEFTSPNHFNNVIINNQFKAGDTRQLNHSYQNQNANSLLTQGLNLYGLE